MPMKTCEVCGKEFKAARKERRFCSNKCKGVGSRKAEKPSKEILESKLNTMSLSAIGREYGVSFGVVRIWAKSYGLKWATRDKDQDKPSSSDS